MKLRPILLLVSLAFFPLAALADSPDGDWTAIITMDAGPQKKPTDRNEARTLAKTHFAVHRQAIEKFLEKYPNDPRVPQARMKLADILAATGNMEGIRQQIEQAAKILTELESSGSTPPNLRADAAFRRISLFLQSTRGHEVELRSTIVQTARDFVKKYPDDRRGPRLLVEASSVCDNAPDLKRELLVQARDLTNDAPLKRQIADDLGRIDRLNLPLDLRFPTIQGKDFDVANNKGKVVVIVFWSAESPHCILWMPKFRKAIASLPRDRFIVATVSVDTNRAELDRRRTEFGLADWPTFFDGKGWESPTIRQLGINALPTVFVIDKSGLLRALNAQNNCELWVDRLMREQAK